MSRRRLATTLRRAVVLAVLGLGLLTVFPSTRANAVSSDDDVARLQILKYQKLLERNPTNEKLIDGLVDAIGNTENPVLRVEGARVGLRYAPTNQGLRLELAQALLDQELHKEALAEFMRLLPTNYEVLQVLVGLGNCHDGLKDPAEGLRFFEQARARDPRNIEILESVGDDNGWLGKYREAFAAYDGVLAPGSGADEATRKRVTEKVEALRKEEREATSDASEGGDEDLPLDEQISRTIAALTLAPADRALHLKLGLLYAKGLRFEQAIPEFAYALGAAATRYDALVELGKAFEAMGRETRGRYFVQEATRLAPERWEAWGQLLRHAVAHDAPALAVTALDAAARAGCPPQDLAILKGKHLFFLGRLDEAQRVYEGIRSEIPDETEALEGLAEIALRHDDMTTADRLYARAIEVEPVSTWYMERRADIARRRGDAVLETTMREGALALRPTEIEKYHLLGRVLNERGERERAFDVWRGALSLDPYDRDAIEGLLTCLEQGPTTSGHEELSLLLRERLARAMAADGDHEPAADMLERLATVWDRFASREWEAAGRYRTDMRASLARGRLERSLAATQAEIRIRRLLAELYLDLDRQNLVAVQYHRLLELDPTQAPYVLRLADLYNELGRHRRARQYYASIPPEKLEAAARLRRAESFAAAGSEIDAIRQLKRMEAEEPPDDQVLLKLGEWQLDRGNLWRARDYFTKALGEAAANEGAHDNLRRMYLGDYPDLRLSTTSGHDSDGLWWQERLAEYRCRFRGYRVGVTLGTWDMEDDFAKSSGPFMDLKVGRDLSERLEYELELGQDPRNAAARPSYGLTFQWHASDLVDVQARFFRTGLGETGLSSDRGVEIEGAEVTGQLFASTAVSLQVFLQTASLSDGNSRSSFRGDLEVDLPYKLPGRVRLSSYTLDYDFPVAPVLYYAPQGASGSEVAWEWSVQAHQAMEVEGGVVAGSEDGRGDYSQTRLGASYEIERNRQLTISWQRERADRSIHGGLRPYERNELTVGANFLY